MSNDELDTEGHEHSSASSSSFLTSSSAASIAANKNIPSSAAFELSFLLNHLSSASTSRTTTTGNANVCSLLNPFKISSASSPPKEHQTDSTENPAMLHTEQATIVTNTCSSSFKEIETQTPLLSPSSNITSLGCLVMPLETNEDNSSLISSPDPPLLAAAETISSTCESKSSEHVSSGEDKETCFVCHKLEFSTNLEQHIANKHAALVTKAILDVSVCPQFPEQQPLCGIKGLATKHHPTSLPSLPFSSLSSACFPLVDSFSSISGTSSSLPSFLTVPNAVASSSFCPVVCSSSLTTNISSFQICVSSLPLPASAASASLSSHDSRCLSSSSFQSFALPASAHLPACSSSSCHPMKSSVASLQNVHQNKDSESQGLGSPELHGEDEGEDVHEDEVSSKQNVAAVKKPPFCGICRFLLSNSFTEHWLSTHPELRLSSGVRSVDRFRPVLCPACGDMMMLKKLSAHWNKQHPRCISSQHMFWKKKHTDRFVRAHTHLPLSFPVFGSSSSSSSSFDCCMSSSSSFHNSPIMSSLTSAYLLYEDAFCTSASSSSPSCLSSCASPSLSSSSSTLPPSPIFLPLLSTKDYAAHESAIRAAELHLRPQLAAYRSNNEYGLLTVPDVLHSVLTLKEVVKNCADELTQGFYRREVHPEVQRLVDKSFKVDLWAECRDSIRELLTQVIALSHNSSGQRSLLEIKKYKCDIMPESDEKTRSENRHPKEQDFLFWGGQPFEIANHDESYEQLTQDIIEYVQKRSPNAEYRAKQQSSLFYLNKILESVCSSSDNIRHNSNNDASTNENNDEIISSHTTVNRNASEESNLCSKNSSHTVDNSQASAHESKCYCELFGSVAAGLDTVGSDLDCGVIGVEGGEKFISFLKRVATKLRRSNAYRNIQPILNARIPLVKCTDKYTGIDIDITQMLQSQHLKTKLLRRYRELDERFSILTYIVKKFAQVNGLGDASAGGLNSFGWTLLVLQFCQMISPPILPNLQDPSQIHDNWRSSNTTNAGTLLVQFFIFYTRRFHPFRDCVSIQRGCFCPAPERRNPNPPPPRIATARINVSTQRWGKKANTTPVTISSPTITGFSSPTITGFSSPISDFEDIASLLESTPLPELRLSGNTVPTLDRDKHETKVIDLHGSESDDTQVTLLRNRYFQGRQQTFFCVEDPLDFSDNVGRGLGRIMVEDIYTAMSHVRDLLRSNPTISLRAVLYPLPSPKVRWTSLVSSKIDCTQVE